MDAPPPPSLSRLWRAIADRLTAPPDRAEAEAVHDAAATTAPVLWLLGKTGVGKTSIVAALTGDKAAEVGAGFAPCTRTARVFDLPAEAPLLRFLDTRGLEEPGYDAAEDIAWCETQAHLILAVLRVDDPAQGAVLAALRAARRRHPDWPLVVAQTHLHALYPAGAPHPDPYPFTGGVEDLSHPAIPHALRQALAHQRALFDDLPGPAPRFVPLDFTDAADGYDPIHYGLDALLAALAEAGPAAAAALRDGGARDE
ncbi:GTPase family protein, partial [Falsiroseomonas oryziterrae]|uniref:GTPase family protein n=1 Tax=Falsiroseomonas oryziterrae TaxID=2911368 RepID=UPI001F330A43